MGFPHAKPRLGCVGPQRPGCLAGRQFIFSTLHMTAMASSMFILGPCRHHRWRNPRAVMPQQGQRPNGLLTCERKVESHEWLMHTDSHSDVALGLYSEISIYQEIEITTSAKSDTAFQNPAKSRDCHGPKNQRNNQGYTKNLWELCNSEMWRWWRVNSPRAVSAEFLHPRLGEVVDSWRMRWHETTWDDGQTLQGVRPCPAWRCESWTTCAAFSQQVKRRWPMKRQNDAV